MITAGGGSGQGLRYDHPIVGIPGTPQPPAATTTWTWAVRDRPELRHRVGIETITWECDYPHSDSTWPVSPERLWKLLSKVPREEIDAMTHRNAMRIFHYDPFATIPRAEATVGALRAKAAHVDLTPLRGVGGKAAGTGRGDVVRMAQIARQLAGALDG